MTRPRETCRHGHPWTPENIYPGRKGNECRTCRSEFGQRWREQNPDYMHRHRSKLRMLEARLAQGQRAGAAT